MARQRTWGPELPVSSLTAHGPFLAWLLGEHIIKQQHDTIHIISPLHLACVCFVAKLAALPTLLHIAQRVSRVVSRSCPLQTAILTII